MLWGYNAKMKKKQINTRKHRVLEAVHPSPRNPKKEEWFENCHFSQCNTLLEKAGREPVNWGNLPTPQEEKEMDAITKNLEDLRTSDSGLTV